LIKKIKTIIIPVVENIVAPRYVAMKGGPWVCYSPRALYVLNPGLPTVHGLHSKTGKCCLPRSQFKVGSTSVARNHNRWAQWG